jgi:hypothetical protein
VSQFPLQSLLQSSDVVKIQPSPLVLLYRSRSEKIKFVCKHRSSKSKLSVKVQNQMFDYVHQNWTPDTPQMHLRYTPHTPRIHLGFTPRFTPRYTWDTPQIYPEYTPGNTQDTPPEASLDTPSDAPQIHPDLRPIQARHKAGDHSYGRTDILTQSQTDSQTNGAILTPGNTRQV